MIFSWKALLSSTRISLYTLKILLYLSTLFSCSCQLSFIMLNNSTKWVRKIEKGACFWLLNLIGANGLFSLGTNTDTFGLNGKEEIIFSKQSLTKLVHQVNLSRFLLQYLQNLLLLHIKIRFEISQFLLKQSDLVLQIFIFLLPCTNLLL